MYKACTCKKDVIVGIALALCLLCSKSRADDYAFVNDISAFIPSPDWYFSTYRDVIVDDNDTVTVFFHENIPHATYNQNYQDHFRRFDKLGNAFSPPVMISDSSLYQTRSNFHVGGNQAGKWVLCNTVRYNCPDWPFCDMQLRAWVSSANGSEVDTEIIVGDGLGQQSRHTNASAALDSVGNFAISWTRNSTPDSVGYIMYQLFYADGAERTQPLIAGDNFLPDGSVLGEIRNSNIDMSPGGDFVVVWQARCDGPSCEPEESGPFTFARLFYADGTPKTDAMRASDVLFEQPIPTWWTDVAMADDGRFAISYSRMIQPCGYVEFTALPVIKRFDADGNALGPEIVLDSVICETNIAMTTSVVSDADFNLLASWQNSNEGLFTTGLANIMAQRVDSSGALVGQRYRINDNSDLALKFNSSCALNNNGLSAFYWGEIPTAKASETLDFVQIMDYDQVGIYVPGDANNNTTISISDAVYIINYIFGGGYSPAVTCIADANGDQTVSIGDAVAIINYIFGGGLISGDCK